MENKIGLIDMNPVDGQLYIVKIVDGQPDWDNAQPFDGVIGIDVGDNDITACSFAQIAELWNASLEDDTVQRLKQRHYDETHSRKANWHKRYF